VVDTPIIIISSFFCQTKGVALRLCLDYKRFKKVNNKRPKHLALHLIKLPLPGIISILHRISGALLFLMLPLLLWTLQYSLQSEQNFAYLTWMFQHPASKLFLIFTLWLFLHHFCAGIRYLLIDMHWFSNLAGARLSSKIVLVVSVALTILFGVQLW
jgi:succinate dehydrogenase / fumarate reductase cytochrome b subunit